MPNKFFRTLFVLCLVLFSIFAAHAQRDADDPIPINPQVKKGTLANGLTYYIQKNARPEKRLELRLAVKAGSVLEDDDQKGLAHFVEHMAFNGSTHFKKNELVSYLQSIGLKFGPDLNAYTSFNETVYQLPIQTDKPEDVRTGFLVLADWAQGITFNAEDVELERGVVLEELRTRKGVQDRVSRVMLPKLFNGSQYSRRLPIGDENTLKTFTLDSIKRFYRDWYRPNLMAVVVVGDIAPAQALQLLETHFGGMKNPDNERPRTYPEIAQHAGSETLVITDGELPTDGIQLHYPIGSHPPTVTYSDYRQTITERLFQFMLGQRMQELTQQAKPPFIGGASLIAHVAPGYRRFMTQASVGRQGVGSAIEALVQENERVRQLGFSQGELHAAKKVAMGRMEQIHAGRGTVDSSVYAAEYVRNFLVRETIPGIEKELRYHQDMLPSILLDDVNEAARRLVPDSKTSTKLLVYTGSGKADTATPEKLELDAILKQAEQISVSPRQEPKAATSLMPQKPTPGSIVAERSNVFLGLTEIDLSNGIKVILKPTDFKDDQILLSAIRPGGRSRFELADKHNALYADKLAASMGLGGFSPTELRRMLAGKAVSVTSSLAEYSEHLIGSSTKMELETMLQLAHLKFARPRADTALHQSFVTRMQDAARNTQAVPETVFSDAVKNTVYQSHPRLHLSARPEDFDQLKLERMMEIYTDRFGSAKGMTFVVVGSFSPEAIKPLLSTYLASLPTSDLSTQFVDLGIRPIAGIVKSEVRQGQEQKSLVSLNFTGPAAYSEKEHLLVSALKEVLNIKIIEELRERLRMIYSGGISGSLFQVPYENFYLQVTLPCAPENVDKVAAAAFAEIQKIQQQGPDPADLAKFKKNWVTNHHKVLRENGYWLQTLQSAALHGRDPAVLRQYEDWVNGITVKDVQDAALRYLSLANYAQVSLLPKS